MTVLTIAGHGKARNGKIDPGAKGYIEKGEHRYMKENLFPAMKKYVGDADIVFFDEYDVYEHGNIVELARKYGKDTTVIECHFDAGSSDASGGHVIVKAAYAPDKLDLRLRDAIKSMIGVRYNHKGEQGISGRDNLANVNRTAQAGVNYRLIELGFGTNKKDADILMNKTDEYAKKLVEAILNKSVGKQPVTDKPETSKPVETKPAPAKSIETLANEVIAGKHGSGDDRKKALGSQYDAVQKRVNEMLNNKPAGKSIDTLVKETLAGKHGNGDARKKSLGSNYNAVMAVINGKSTPTAKPAAKSIETLANETIAGKHGSGEARKKSLGSNYNAVQKRVNEILGGKKSASKSLNTIADEVIKGLWGNGQDRTNRLKKAGYNPNEVQKLVNKKL